ncbi:hypothetical protein JHK82_027408 [Glycine max]|nr:hypothetical protein JHK82_027408 [Glycine max]
MAIGTATPPNCVIGVYTAGVGLALTKSISTHTCVFEIIERRWNIQLHHLLHVNQEIIAIKAPKASCIEVPDPDEDDRKFEDDSAKRMKLMDPSWNSDPIRKRGVGLLESQHDEKKSF